MDFKLTQDNVNLDFTTLSPFSQSFLAEQALSLQQNLEQSLKINKQLLLRKMLSLIEDDGIIKEENQLHEEKEKDVQDAQLPLSLQKSKSQLIKNDTKNIPKNFGTAISLFIKKKSYLVKKLLAKKNLSYTQFLQFNKTIKNKLNSLIDLRGVWSDQEGTENQKMFKQCFRILSFEFLRRHSLEYIFDSRIKNTGSHIRYRAKLIEGLKSPSDLVNLKDY